MKKIQVIHGPNLNLLGTREPEIYGKLSLNQIDQLIMEKGQKEGVQIDCFQSNSEGAIVDKIQSLLGQYNGLIINPAAYTHYSIAIRDAISAIGIPTIEVHLSDIHSREEFRKVSVVKDVCKEQVSGHQENSYIMAIDLLLKNNF